VPLLLTCGALFSAASSAPAGADDDFPNKDMFEMVTTDP
jgi:hypothetical protein